MNVRASRISAILLMAVVPVWAQYGSEAKPEGKSEGKAEVGKPAPDFTLKDTEGKEHKLSAYKGKVVVLEWTNHECPVVQRCHKAKMSANTLASFKDEPVVWLAIDSSHFAETKTDGIRKWAKDNSVNLPILLDAPGKVGRMYEAKTTPHMFVIDQKGVLAYAGAFDDDAYGTKPEGERRNYVAEAVSSLLEGSAVATATTTPYGCTVKYKQ